MAVWCSLNNLELNTLKTVEMIVILGETPLLSPPEQHCNGSGVTQVPGHRHLSGSEVGQSHRLHCEKGPAEVIVPSPAEEVQPATGAAETVLLCHHWISPLHVNNCLVQLKSDLRRLRRVVQTAERIIGTPPPPPAQSPGTVLIQSEQKSWKNHSGPSHPAHSLFELIPSGRRYRALSTRTTRHRNSFFPQAIISWTLDNNYGTHTIYTLLHLFI